MSEQDTDGDDQGFPDREELEKLLEERPDPETFHQTALLVLAGSRVLDVLEDQSADE